MNMVKVQELFNEMIMADKEDFVMANKDEIIGQLYKQNGCKSLSEISTEDIVDYLQTYLNVSDRELIDNFADEEWARNAIDMENYDDEIDGYYPIK